MRSISRSLSRRRLICVALLILMAFQVGFGFVATSQTSIAGHWEGAITLPSGALNLSVDFARSADGKLSATVTIPRAT